MEKIVVLLNNSQKTNLEKIFNKHSIDIKVFDTEDKLLSAISTKSFSAVLFFAENKDVKETDKKYLGNIDLLMKLRVMQQSVLPIFILSNLSKKALINVTNKNKYWKEAFEAVKSPEVYLICEPFKDKLQSLLKAIAQAESIDKHTLNDVQYSFFSPRGIVHNIMHDLKNDLYTTHTNASKKGIKEKLVSLVKTAFAKAEPHIPKDNIGRFKEYFQLYCNDIESDIDNIKDDTTKLESYRYNKASFIGTRYMQDVYSLMPDVEKKVDTTKKESRWECVAIDDTEKVRDMLKDYFESKNIKCHLFRDYQSAKDTIQNNKKVTAVITDLRIIEPDGSWNKYQGYKILEEVRANCSRPLAYFVLTGKRGTVSNLIQESFDFKVHWFIKDDVLSSDGAFNLFFYEHLAKECDKIQFQLLRQPRLSNKVWWTNTEMKGKDNSNRFTLPLSQYYKAHIESYEYPESETRINEFTKRFVDEVKKGTASVVPEITCTIKEKRVTDNGLKKFRDNILTGRRIAYALANQSFSPKEILEKFQNKSSNPKAVFNTSLATASNPANDLDFIKAIDKGDKAECNLLIEELNLIGPELKDKLRLNEDDFAILENILEHANRFFGKNSPKELLKVLRLFEDFKTPKRVDIEKALIACQNLKRSEVLTLLKSYSDYLQSPPLKTMVDKFLYSA